MSEITSSIKSHFYENSLPVVSVQMPVFNGGKYLAEAVESILNQTFRDFEFLLLDDGSTDDSLRLLHQYAGKDSRLRVFSRENRGVGETQYELAQLARGEFIAQLDQDDIALPNRLELQVDFLRKNPKVVCVGGAFQMIDGAGRYLTTLKMPQTNIEIQALILGGHGAITHSCAMMRSTQLKVIGGYDKNYNLAQDLDLWLRLGEIGELANLKDVILKYRLHDKSLSETSGKKQREEARLVCENAWQRRSVAGVFSAENLWRPGSDRTSRHSFMLKYGWWAWNSRQRKTAFYYGCKAIKSKPFSMAGWKLLAVSLLKPLMNTNRG
ncbi:chondroitin synthase [mine drainage metagenome]|uniref:Chondroitin synthase n=1 Tax=mine drainage metagenome TaxID=410659 RepID=A0A1J5SIN6_9ZZZZ